MPGNSGHQLQELITGFQIIISELLVDSAADVIPTHHITFSGPR